MGDSFYLHAVSTASSNVFKDNTPTRFHSEIHLDGVFDAGVK